MGYELRRALRKVLGPEITGLQRAVALEIADDARDETRLSWASLEDLAVWTGAKDVNVIRNALKRLAAAGWEFRVPRGVGKDGRVLYAVPGKRLSFRVPDFEGGATATLSTEDAANEPAEGVATARSQGAPAPSERATAPSEGAPATPFSSGSQDSSSLSSQGEPPSDAPAEDEREKKAAPEKPTTAQRVVRASGAVSADEERAFIAWAVAKFTIQSPGWWHKAAGDVPELAETWRASLAPGGRPAGPPLPPWCGECDGESLAERWVLAQGDGGYVSASRCPRCNPHHPGVRGQPGAA